MNSPRSFRTTELVKEFAKQGHDVTLIIPKNKNEHLDFEKEYGIKIKSLGETVLPRFDIKKNNKYFNFLIRGFKRILLQLLQYPDIELMFQVKRALKNEKGYDLMISIASPHTIHWGTAWARTKNNLIAKIWVADCGDPFMGATLDSFKKLFYFKYIEKWWCKKANYITIPFKGARKGYYKEFQHKLRVIPQGINFNIELPTYKKNKVPTFAYAGGLIPARNPKKFIEYLLSLNIDFKFILYTKQLNFISPFLSKPNKKIVVKDYVPRKTLLFQLSKMDFIVNFENGISTQLPSKLIDYYLTQRPVLSINTLDFDKAIVDKFLNRDYRYKYKYSDVNQYHIERVSNQFLKLNNNAN